MLCQHCQKNTASVQFTENLNGKIKEMKLCPTCTKQIEQNIFNNIQKTMKKFDVKFEGDLSPQQMQKVMTMMDDPMKMIQDIFGIDTSKFANIQKPTHVHVSANGQKFHVPITKVKNSSAGSDILELKKRIIDLQQQEKEAVKKENYLEAADLKKSKEALITQFIRRTAIKKIPLEGEIS